jgi:hypothetical protein
MKTFLAVLFDLVHNRRNDNNNRNNNEFLHQEVASFLRADSLRSFLRIDNLHDLIINHIAPHVTAIEEFGCLIYTIVQDQQSAEPFSSVESFSAILKCFHRSKALKDAVWIASCINNILAVNPSSNKLLNSLPVVEAFSFIIPLVNDAEAVRWILHALKKILDNNEEAQQKFGTPEFFQIFKGMEKHTTTDYSKMRFNPSLDSSIRPIIRNLSRTPPLLLNSNPPLILFRDTKNTPLKNFEISSSPRSISSSTLKQRILL